MKYSKRDSDSRVKSFDCIYDNIEEKLRIQLRTYMSYDTYGDLRREADQMIDRVAYSGTSLYIMENI